MRFWYFFHKITSTFLLGFLSGTVAAVLIIVSAIICGAVFT